MWRAARTSTVRLLLRRGRRRGWRRRRRRCGPCPIILLTRLIVWWSCHDTTYEDVMDQFKSLDGLREFDDDILKEVVREAELMMAAQLSVATASDQRALTWAGFVLTIAIASIGGSASLAIDGKQLPLAAISGAGAILMAISGYYAVRAVRPRKYSMPGNLPQNWLPEHWESGRTRDFRQARIEQARTINGQIVKNAALAERNATDLNHSIHTAGRAVLLAGVYVIAYLTYTILR